MFDPNQHVLISTAPKHEHLLTEIESSDTSGPCHQVFCQLRFPNMLLNLAAFVLDPFRDFSCVVANRYLISLLLIQF